MSGKKRISTRSILRAFQAARQHKGGAIDSGLFADLEMVRHKDLDLSIKAGALLAFQGLLLTAGINPIAASPGAPLSVSPVDEAAVVIVTAIGVGLLAWAATYCVRCIMIGEDFDDTGLEADPHGVAIRMLAAYCVAIDKQTDLLAKAVLWTYAGGGAMAVAFFWALIGKWM
ncbi:MAG: hypothetical protein ABWZ40_10605 [Caulobacterales bacterium]